MMKWLLGLDHVPEDITYFEWYLRRPLHGAVLLLIAAAIVVFTVWLYRRSGNLSVRGRVLLGAVRAMVLLLLVVMILEPVFAVEFSVKDRRTVLVLVDKSQSMAIADTRRTDRELASAAIVIGEIDAPPAGDDVLPKLTQTVRNRVRQVPREQIAAAVLTNRQLGLLDGLAEENDVRLFAFGEELFALDSDRAESLKAITNLPSGDEATELGASFIDAVDRYAGRSLAGVVLLTDGASNLGIDPVEAAREMADRGVRLYPVGVGLPDPPDVAVRKTIVQDVVFPEDKVPVRVQISSTGFAQRTTDIVVKLDDREVQRKRIMLTGTTQIEQIEIEPTRADAGSRELTVTVEPLTGEVGRENNTHAQRLRVMDEKIKVLYVEGKPRWEYRYLRAVLQRDHRLDVTFLMTEGDADLAKFSDEHISRFPVEAGEAFAFDLVILGDVPAYYFTPEQLERIEQLVRQRAGSLLMLAGRRHAPGSYRGSAIEAVLPVKLPEADGPPTERLAESVVPLLTAAGVSSAPVTLEDDERDNARAWTLVRPMYDVPRLAGAKPGASVWLQLSDAAERAEPYPLVAWQRYGTGKCLFVGTDALWRLRFKRGDTYHARFWGQTIQFLALSRLLSGSKRINIETDRRQYRTGQRITVYANVLDDVWEPVEGAGYTVTVETEPGVGDSRTVQLEPAPDVPGLYQGFTTAETEGHFYVRAPQADRDYATTAEFDVQTVSLEQREMAMQQQVLDELASLTGGEHYQPHEVAALVDLLASEPKLRTERVDVDQWDRPSLFLLLVSLCGLEWYLRRRVNLV